MIAVRPLRLVEDIETAEPCCERETGQKQNRDSPGKIIDSLPGTRVRLVFVPIVRMSAVVHQFSARRFPLNLTAPLQTTNRIRTFATHLDSRFENLCRSNHR